MSDNYVFRKRAAVLCTSVFEAENSADIASRARTKLLARHHKTLTKSIVKNHGRIVRVIGGEVMAVFVDPLNAVECAIEFQKQAIALNIDAPPAKIVRFRLGIGLGQIAVDKENITGDAVDYAVTLQNATSPDSVWVSGDIPADLQGRMRVVFTEVKVRDDLDLSATNLIAPLRAYRIELDKQAAMRAADYFLPDGRGGLLTLIAPISGMLLLVIISIFWFMD
jgi:class 3 adenylate cyclase